MTHLLIEDHPAFLFGKAITIRSGNGHVLLTASDTDCESDGATKVLELINALVKCGAITTAPYVPLSKTERTRRKIPRS